MAKTINSKKEQNIKTIRFIKLYILPIATLISFIGIILFLIIPKISEILGQLDQISKNNVEIAAKNQELANLNSLASDLNTINQQLNTINEIAPAGTSEVVKFRDKITNIIKGNNLNITSQRLSESSVDTKNTNDPAIAGSILLQEVPFEFEVTGTYNNIVGFINQLNSVDDFIIIKEMELSAEQKNTTQVGTGKWVFKMNIVKYQFKNLKEDAVNKLYLGVNPVIRIDKEIQNYLNLKQVGPNKVSSTQ